MKFNIIPKSEFDKVHKSNLSSVQKSELWALMCRYNSFVSIKKAGSGHIGSSFSAMDIVVYLYLNELNIHEKGLKSSDRDIYFSSKGHDVPGLYSVLFSFGIISEYDLMHLRRLGGLDGHPEIKTKGIEANTGSLGMGISKGRGFAIAKKHLGKDGHVFVLTGDGEFQEGQIYESLQSTAHQKIDKLTVIIDRNKFQTDRLVNNVNSIEDLKEKIESFGWAVRVCNGHDFEDISDSINWSKSIEGKPSLIIADTIKGKGISFIEETNIGENDEQMYKWHSGAPSDSHFTQGINELSNKISEFVSKNNLSEVEYKFVYESENIATLSKKEYITDAYGDELCKLAELRDDFIVIDADLSADCKLRNFERQYPSRFIENGIAEQDMVSMAGGIARMGLIPIVNSFASFLSSRANEQIYNNACEHTKIIYALHFSGMIPAGPGKSHQSVRDISLLGAIPNITIIQPANQIETRLALQFAINDSKENVALRMNIGPCPIDIEFPENYQFKIGTGTILKEGSDAVLFAYGPVMLAEALGAAEILHSFGFELCVINMPFLNRIDIGWLNRTCSKFELFYILEDHSVFGGLGDNLTNALINNWKISVKKIVKIGLDNYPECGQPFEVLNHHKLDAKSIASRIIGGDYNIFSDRSIAYSDEAPQ